MTRRLLHGFLLGLVSTAAVLLPLLLPARPAAGAQSEAAGARAGAAAAQAHAAAGIQSGAGNPHGALDLPCGSCHTAEGWTRLRDEIDFDHATTSFPLERAHRNAECRDCHESLQFSHVATACADCHADPHSGELGLDCASCHSPAGWENRNQIFDIHSTTLFPLTGFHARLDCAACHREEPPFEFALTPTECFSCHAADYAATADPNHVAAGFPTDCAECHSPNGWQEARFGGDFDHSAFFPLTSGHAGLDCAECHVNGRYAGTPTDCYACHRDDYDATTDPNHANAGFPTDCEQCHTIARWDDADFDHNVFFRLTGAHRTADCAECHVNGQYTGTPTDCYACHRTDYNSTEDPDHADLGFPTDCEECHDTRSWDSAEFDHDTFFALTGAHRRADCSGCHVDGRYAGTPTDCYACHREDYSGTTAPDHRKAGFVTDCEECHETKSWATGEFDHDAFFPITGRHRRLACSDCHTSGTYAGTASDCYACHREDYNGTTEPDHQDAGFPTDCEECHTTSGWGGADFDHNVFFRLTGAHRTADCAECHVNGQYAGTPTACVGCHRPDYDGTTEPDHQDAGFPTTCEECHVTTNWDAEFDHDVFFQLTGRHRQADCAECHVNGQYAGTPTTCYGCHRTDYDGTSDPDHADAGFPTTCQQCHSTNNWDATFDHDVFFQLTGAHRQADCAECHVNGKYAGTPTTCYGCHRPDYDGTSDPDHANAGFPTTCEQCHNTSNWDDADFNHAQFFPIASGRHSGFECSECHVYPNNFAAFECIDCHEHNKSSTDNEHDGEVRNYVYQSMACLTCHPDGRGDD